MDDWLRDGARQSLQGYRSGRVTLRRLIDDLDEVWSHVPKSEWSEHFRSQWWVLEEIYAVALDRRELDQLSLDDQKSIGTALDELGRLLS